MNKLIISVLVAAVITLSSCNGGGGYSGSGENGGNGGGGGNTTVVVTTSGPGAVAAGSSTMYAANVLYTNNTAVTWQVDGTAGGNTTVGTISASGSYTAPHLPPAGGRVTITAVSQVDSTKFSSIGVTIQFSNASIQGVYAFSISGSTLGSIVSAAGTFSANGSGTILNGNEDFNGSAGESFSGLSGTYSVGSDGRGSATITTSLGTTIYHFVVLASGQVQLIGFDNGDSINGFAVPQILTALNQSPGLSDLAGDWSFFLSGSSGGTTIVDAGRFSLDSAGNITLGEEDQNSGGTVSSAAAFTGTASSVSTSGRGTASFTGTLGTSKVAFYVQSANTVYFEDVDSGVFLTGTASKQQSANFTASSLNGTYVYLLAGSDNLGKNLAEVGQITLNGSGQVTRGVFDQNDNGNAATNQAITGGNYSIASNGRGTASITSAAGTSNFAFYIVSSDLAVFVETDASSVIEGLATLQTGSPFSNSSISGSYGLTSTGVVSSGGFNSVGRVTASIELDLLTPHGSLSGVEDVDQAFSGGSGIALSGSYKVSANGRGGAELIGGGGAANLVFYMINSSTAEYVEVDPAEVIVGFVARQF